MKHNDVIAKLAYDLTYHKFLLNKDKANHLFSEVDIAEYVALHLIYKTASVHSPHSEHTYLTDLAQKLDMPISGVSHMVSRLKERGFVLWSHTGNGSEGTFVSVTDSGIRAMKRQDAILEDYYGQVIEKFGRENLIQLLAQMEQLENVMNEVFAKEGANADGCDAT